MAKFRILSGSVDIMNVKNMAVGAVVATAAGLLLYATKAWGFVVKAPLSPLQAVVFGAVSVLFYESTIQKVEKVIDKWWNSVSVWKKTAYVLVRATHIAICAGLSMLLV